MDYSYIEKSGMVHYRGPFNFSALYFVVSNATVPICFLSGTYQSLNSYLNSTIESESKDHFQ